MTPMAEETGGRKYPDRNWDAYGVVVASFVGLLALAVSGYTAYLQGKQVRAQVWPRVELGRYGGKGFGVSNTGIGPARVRAVRVTVDGRPVKVWAEVMRTIGYDGRYLQSQISGRVLSPGKEMMVVEVPKGDPAAQKLVDELGDALWSDHAPHKLGFLLCYCSVFDECWLAGTGNLGGVRVDDDEEISRCPIAASDKFLQ
jgi:hypothetical protein